ncbi:MAG: hypothetical protein ACOC6A_06800 [Chloroflexota bacterium]
MRTGQSGMVVPDAPPAILAITAQSVSMVTTAVARTDAPVSEGAMLAQRAAAAQQVVSGNRFY